MVTVAGKIKAPEYKINSSDILLSCQGARAGEEVWSLSTPPCWWSGVMWLHSHRFCRNKRTSVRAMPALLLFSLFFVLTCASVMRVAFDRGM